MIEVTITETLASELADKLLAQIESCCVLLANQVITSDGITRLLVNEDIWPAANDYNRQSTIEAELTPDFVGRVMKRARNAKKSVVFVHSHPGSNRPRFSKTDDFGEGRLAQTLSHRIPDRRHCSLVLSAGGWNARELGTVNPAKLISLGDYRRVLNDRTDATEPEQIFDRQIRAFGSEGQQILKTLTVAIVGLGGTGSIVAEQLSLLGIEKFILIDPDHLELTNLNRVVGASREAIGTPKVELAKQGILRANPAAEVRTIRDDVTKNNVAASLGDADLIMGCTDSHGSRAVLQQVAYQYLIPCVDMGAVIVTQKSKLQHIHGRVQLLTPGRGCFTCSNLLDSKQVRYDLMSPFERQADPYFVGEGEPAPAVISLNGTISSLAVTMVLKIFLGVPGSARHLLYNGINSTLRSVRVPSDPNCFICSPGGSLARGEEWPVLARET